MSIFLGFEGPEGAGKGTLVRKVVARYQERGLDVVHDREPGGTEIGKEFRRILKDPQYQGTFPPIAELFGFLGARATFVDKLVKPALAEGKIFITDRFSLSTMAYQLAGRGLSEVDCLPAISLAEGGLKPHYVVLLVTPEKGLARKAQQGDDQDRFAQEDLDYHRRVYEGYRRYGKRADACIIDTDELDADAVFKRVIAHLDREYGEKLRAA